MVRLGPMRNRMSRLVQFVLALVASLALLAWAVSAFVHETARQWFERDLRSRARLMVTGARASLAANWITGQRQALQEQLVEMARNERVTAVAACDVKFAMVASTPDYPGEFGCDDVG